MKNDIAAAARTRGIQPISRELRLCRATILAYLAGACRPGTALLIESKWAALQAARSAVAAAPPIDAIEPGLRMRA
jgi:hypothetical protein